MHAAILGAALLCGLIYAFTFENNKEDIVISAVEETTEKPEKDSISDNEANRKICVYICGSVSAPGIYFLEEETRLFTLIDQAGGFAGDAARDTINLAEALSDGQKIYVPSQQEIEAGYSREGFPADGMDGRVNINTADEKVLETLPGIGQIRAKSIIDFRTENGKFDSPEDIMKVNGIKKSLYEKIRELIKT